MKARLANVIGKRMYIYFMSDREDIFLKDFPLETTFEDAREQLNDEVNKYVNEPDYGGTSYHNIWDTPSGKLEPGCLYWNYDYPKNYYWDNQEGPHLMAVLPNGNHWCIDSRASNCTLPDDRIHRCWVRQGELPNITVGKGGNTCSAGAGSILSGNYHGFLQNGVFSD